MYNINNDKLIENNIININEIYEFEKSNIDEDSYNNYLEYSEQMSNEFMRQISEVYLEKNIDPIEVLRPEYSMDIGYISTFYDGGHAFISLVSHS